MASRNFIRPRATSNPARTRNMTSSFSQLSSKQSCPSLAAIASPRHPISRHHGGTRITSASLINREADAKSDSHGYCYGQHLGVVNLKAPGFPKVPCRTLVTSPGPMNKSCQAQNLEFSRYIIPELQIDKHRRISFRIPLSAPQMLSLQTSFFAPKPKTLMSPQVSFSTSSGSEKEHTCSSSSAQADAMVATVLEPQRRSPPPHHRPPLRTTLSSEAEHVLSVCLPGFSPEMVTISARKDNKLAVVADLWHAENNCHHEWLVTFPGHDVNLTLTRAQFQSDGTLTIYVPRIDADFPFVRSRLR